MIFVIMGMEVHPFDRLARAVDDLQRSGQVGEEFFVQLGSCRYEPRNARFQRFLSFGEVCENIRRASVVITMPAPGHPGLHPAGQAPRHGAAACPLGRARGRAPGALHREALRRAAWPPRSTRWRSCRRRSPRPAEQGARPAPGPRLGADPAWLEAYWRDPSAAGHRRICSGRRCLLTWTSAAVATAGVTAAAPSGSIGSLPPRTPAIRPMVSRFSGTVSSSAPGCLNSVSRKAITSSMPVESTIPVAMSEVSASSGSSSLDEEVLPHELANTLCNGHGQGLAAMVGESEGVDWRPGPPIDEGLEGQMASCVGARLAYRVPRWRSPVESTPTSAMLSALENWRGRRRARHLRQSRATAPGSKTPASATARSRQHLARPSRGSAPDEGRARRARGRAASGAAGSSSGTSPAAARLRTCFSSSTRSLYDGGSEFASSTTSASRNGKRPSTECAISIRSPCEESR